MENIELLEREIWKDIPEWEGIYQISNLGRVGVLKRPRKAKNGKIFYQKAQIIKPLMKAKGYYQVNLTDGKGRNKWLSVHRLVAITFLGKFEGLQVNHKNGIKIDNKLENLEWLSASENVKHAFRTGLKTARKDDFPNSKLNKADAIEIRRLHNTRQYTQRKLAKIYEVSFQLINLVVNNKIWI